MVGYRMKQIRKIMRLLSFIILGVFALSCSKDEDKGGVSLAIEGINQTYKNGSEVQAAEVKIVDFKLSIRDVEFKKDQASFDSNDVQFRGPFDIDLMSETDALKQTIGTVELNDGTYSVLRFKLHKSTDRLETDLLYDRSLFMSGTINGVPFEFWHDTSENFDFESNSGIVVNGNQVDLVVQFNMDHFLSSTHAIDLLSAIDENEDGIIKINPDDEDGNGDIADALKENIKTAADLIKL